MILRQFTLFFFAVLLCFNIAAAQTPINNDPFAGWNILRDNYDDESWLDIISYEWDYYTIADTESGFTAIISYLVSNPRGHLSDKIRLLPDGGNVAFVGQFGVTKPIAVYDNYGLDNYEASAEERTFSAETDEHDGYGFLEPVMGAGPNGEDAMHLTGQNYAANWDLIVFQEWTERNEAENNAVRSYDAGFVPGEVWIINPIWHRTRIIGTVTNRLTGEKYEIDGHGYREIAWGRFLLTPDGWDTLFFSEAPKDLEKRGIDRDKGVSIINLTYHKSKILDFADISFYDNNKLVSHRFKANNGEMRWKHANWTWDKNAWQCVPVNGEWEYENNDYLIKLRVDVGLGNMGTLLSKLTLPVKVYFINEYFPYYDGIIYEKKTGRIVREFSGKGVGEFAFHKSTRLWKASDFECNLWGKSIFYHK